MDVQFEYNFKGILPVPGKAFKAKKILVASLFILLALTIYSIFAYLALMADGNSGSEIFSSFGLVPSDNFVLSSNIGVILGYYLGPLLALLIIMLGTTAVSAIDFEVLRGNPFLSSRQAIQFGLKRIRQLFVSELVIAVLIALIVALGIIIGLVTRIPYIGGLLYSLFFFFPNFIVALLTTFAILIQILSILILPAAVAADRNGEVFKSIVETFLTVTRQPFRWFCYTLYVLAAAKIGSFIFAYLSYRAVQFLIFVTKLGGGEEINNLIASGLNHLPINSPAVKFITNLFPGLNFGFDLSLPLQGGTNSLAGYIMAVMLFLIFLIIWAYLLSVVATGQAYIYAIIKKKRDNYVITDEKPLFFKSEWYDPNKEE